MSESERNNIDPSLLEKLVNESIRENDALFDKASAYTNLIILAGYASFFGLWSITKDMISNKEALWSALFMSVSVVSFVFFEVIKNMLVSTRMIDHAKIHDDQEITSDWEKYRSAILDNRAKIRRYNAASIYIWKISWSISVVAGLLAMGVLIYSFISGLFFLYW